MDNLRENSWRDDESEIDLIQLLVELLKNIRPILICACICAAVFLGGRLLLSVLGSNTAEEASGEEAISLDRYGVGGMIGVTGWEESEAIDPETGEPKSQARLKYEREMELYQLKLASYQEQFAKTLDLISRNEVRRRDSVLLNLDPQSFFQKDGVWYVDTHYQVSPGMSLQNTNPINSVMSAYQTLLNSGDFYYYVQEHISDPIDVRYIGELLPVSTNSGTAMLTVTAVGSTEKMANELFEAAKGYLESHKPQISGVVSDYDITLVEEWSYDAANPGSSSSGSRAYMNSIISEQDSFNDQLSELQNTALDLQSKLLQLEEPKPASGEGGTLSGALKFGVIGGVIGVVLAAIYFVIRFVAKDAALSEDELRRRYGVFVLASVKRFPGEGKWQKMLAKLCGDEKRSVDIEETAGLAQANITSILEADGQERGKVLLVGKDTVALSEVESLTTCKENGGIVVGGDIMTDKGAVEMLREYENVVLVERKEETSYREIGRELEKLALLNKNVVGLIAL